MAFRLTEKEARAFGLKIPERPQRKYHNQPDRLDGIFFDSQWELRRYAYLVHVELAKQLEDLKVHPKFGLYAAKDIRTDRDRRIRELVPDICVGEYEADFSYRDERGDVVEDVKGMVLPLYQLKRRIFLANYPGIQLMEVRLWRNQWRSQRVVLDAMN